MAPPPYIRAIKEQAVREAVESLVGDWESRKRGVIGDQKLMGRAVTEKFTMPATVAQALMIATTINLANPDARASTIAAKTPLAAEAQNQADRHHADRLKIEGTTAEPVMKLWGYAMPMDGV